MLVAQLILFGLKFFNLIAAQDMKLSTEVLITDSWLKNYLFEHSCILTGFQRDIHGFNLNHS